MAPTPRSEQPKPGRPRKPLHPLIPLDEMKRKLAAMIGRPPERKSEQPEPKKAR